MAWSFPEKTGYTLVNISDCLATPLLFLYHHKFYFISLFQQKRASSAGQFPLLAQSLEVDCIEHQLVCFSLLLSYEDVITSVNLAQRGPSQNWALCLSGSVQTTTGTPEDFQIRMQVCRWHKNWQKGLTDQRIVLPSREPQKCAVRNLRQFTRRNTQPCTWGDIPPRSSQWRWGQCSCKVALQKRMWGPGGH